LATSKRCLGTKEHSLSALQVDLLALLAQQAQWILFQADLSHQQIAPL
jgi:hypothetical protein